MSATIRAGGPLDLATLTAMNASAAAAAESKAAVADIAAYRAEMDQLSPRWLMLSLLLVVLFVIVLDIPRIFNRFRSTYPRLFAKYKDHPGPVPGGGEFFKGWRLRWTPEGYERRPSLAMGRRRSSELSIRAPLPRPRSFSMGKLMLDSIAEDRAFRLYSIQEEAEEKTPVMPRPCPPGFNYIPPTPVIKDDMKFGIAGASEKLGWAGGGLARERGGSQGSTASEKEWKSKISLISDNLASQSSQSVNSNTPILPYDREQTPSPAPSSANSARGTPKPPKSHLPPAFVPPLLSYLPFSPFLLLTTPFPRHFPHLTLAQIFLFAVYCVFVALSLTYRADYSFSSETNPAGPDILRVGWVSLSLVPVVVCIGGRNSIVRWMLGGGDNVIVQRVHKLVGRTMFACILMHAGLYWHKWVVAGKFQVYAAQPLSVSAHASLGFLTLIVITSLPFCRARFYGIFTVCHTIGMFGFLIALIFHVPAAIPFVATAFAVYALDLLARAAKTKLGMAELTVLEGAETTVISVNGLGDGWRAGQYVVVRIPALAKATGLAAFEGHPFTIASASGTDGLVLMVKKTGDWTKALYEMAASGEGKGDEAGSQFAMNARVLIEGPYGGPGHTLFASYSSLVIFAGGSGISFALAVAQDLLAKANKDQSVQAKTINLVWICKTQDIARPMVKYLHALVEDARLAERRFGDTAPILKVDIYITRSPASSPIDIIDESMMAGGSGRASPIRRPSSPDNIPSAPASIAEGTSSGIEVTSRRPMLGQLVESAVDVGEQDGGVGVAVCGPAGLVTGVRAAVKSVKEWRRLKVGGVELHEEFFGF